MVRLKDPLQMEVSALWMVPYQVNQTLPCSDCSGGGETQGHRSEHPGGQPARRTPMGGSLTAMVSAAHTSAQFTILTYQCPDSNWRVQTCT